MNILSNAVKFTIKGGITIHITKKSEYIRISIKDSGVGIKEEDLPKLFKEFCSLSNNQEMNPNGTGLGLYLCKKLALLMDGGITVKSVYGNGSKFSLEIPFAKDATMVDSKESTSINDLGISKYRQKKDCQLLDLSEDQLIPKKFKGSQPILVVDDDPMNSFVLKQLLKHHSLKSDIATNWKEAIEMVKSKGPTNSYSLILMDINMPMMSGVEVIIWII